MEPPVNNRSDDLDSYTARLRAKANERLPDIPDNIDDLSSDDIKKLVQELKVHQIELQMQNEELIEAHGALELTKDKLKSSRDRFYELFHQAPVGYVTMTDAGVVVKANETFARMSALPLHRIEGKPLINLMAAKEQQVFRSRFKSFAKNPEGKKLELTFQQMPNKTYIAQLEAVLAEFSSEELQGNIPKNQLFVTITDISRLKAFEQQTLLAKELAEKASKAKSEFLARMSHELRTPLNAVLGFGQLLQQDKVGLKERQYSAVEHILSAGQHLLDLINELLDISAVDAGKMQLELRNYSIKKHIEESVSLVATLGVQRRVKIKTNLQDDHLVRADRQRLKQVLVNLLTNAVKYNRDMGSVLVYCQVRGSMLRVSIEDTGYGIRHQDLARVFQPFQRLGDNAAAVEGTGLGLVITKQLVEAMDGRVGFESKEKIGSTFWFELPLGHDAGEICGEMTEPSVTEKFAIGYHYRKVLYIEDSLPNQRLMEQFFSNFDQLDLICASTGKKGIALAQQINPDLILLDVDLPDINGIEVLRRTQDLLQKMPPVIAITAMMNEDYERQAKDLGLVDYLSKPVNFIQLSRLINDL